MVMVMAVMAVVVMLQLLLLLLLLQPLLLILLLSPGLAQLPATTTIPIIISVAMLAGAAARVFLVPWYITMSLILYEHVIFTLFLLGALPAFSSPLVHWYISCCFCWRRAAVDK